jgi:hypothetical protein
MRSSRALLLVFACAALVLSVVVARPAAAQVFGPPMTVFGSVTDSTGDVPEGLIVEAYVGDRVCGRGLTQFTGEGDGRVTVYYADVVSREQTAGCGSPGAEVRIRIGDRFAPQTAQWRAGPVQLDVTFGDATPRPIPTFTPTPQPDDAIPAAPTAAVTPVPQTPTAAASASVSPSPSPTATVAAPTITPTPTLSGGLSTREPGAASGSDDEVGESGFPIWAMVVIGLGALVALGGGVGYMMARSRREPGDDDA